MAQTKVSLIKDAVITVDHLHNSHGITTDHIGEGSKLFYTDSRVSSYLSSNNYIRTSDVSNLETVTSLSINANILSYTNEAGLTTNIDLSTYLDDTNLARLVSGTLNAGTGIATFTRDDLSTFTIDFSAFIADANDYVSSGSFNTSTGVLTLTRLGGGTVTVDLDGKYAEVVHAHDDRYYTELESDGRFAPISHTHLWSHITDRPTALSAFTNDLGNYGGFLTSFTETDPIYTASSWYTTPNNSANWNTAYSWGNHAGLYASISHTHTFASITSKPTTISGYGITNAYTDAQIQNFFNGANAITGYNKSNWDTAYSWGNHAGLYASINHTHIISPISETAVPSAGISIQAGPGSNNTQGWAYPYGTRLSAITSAGRSFEIMSTTYPNGELVMRTLDGSNVWDAWKTIIDSSNISSQSVNYATGAGNSTTTSQRSFNYLYATDYLETSGAVYGTVFYDNNDRGYYLDPNGFSNLHSATFNANWAGSAPHQGAINIRGNYPSMMFRNFVSNTAWLRHMDGSGNIQHYYVPDGYDSSNWSIKHTMQGDGTFYSASSMRSPIFYDSNDTGYYIDPASTGTALNINGGISTPTMWVNQSTSNYNNYNENIRLFPAGNSVSVIAFGASGTGGTPWNSVLGYSDRFEIRQGNQWQQRNYANYVEAYGSFRAPIFYDSNDTGYFLDPASGSNLNQIRMAGHLSIGNLGDSSPSTVSTSARITFGSLSADAVSNYSIGTTIENYGGSYNKLDLAFHTGIRLGAHPNYGGVRFFSDQTMTTEIASIGRSGNYIDAVNSMRAPIFYDNNNTGYYVDPSSTSNLNVVGVANRIYTGYDPGDANSISCSNWFRSNGTTGWYSGSYGGGIHMIDSTWVRVYNGKKFYVDGTASDQIMTNGSVKASVFYDYNDSNYYLDPNSGTVSLKTAGGIVTNGAFGTNGYGSGNLVGRVYGPRGATYSSAVASVTGAIKIRLPIRANDTMWSMKVRIYNYRSNDTSEYLIGNYAYSAGAWNYGATYSGTSNSTPRTVRFGNDGSYDCVWIGETSTTWSHPVVSVMDFMGGYSNGNVENWDDYWSITFVDIFNTVAASIAPDVNFNEVFSYSYRGNSNVAGTGNASYHPSGIYSTSTNWLYGTMYLNNNAIYDVGNIRSGIFYDKDNTNYYCDPNSLSRFDRIDPNEIYNYGWFRNHESGEGVYNQATGQHFYSDDGAYWNMGGGNINGQGIRFRDTHNSTIRGYVYYDQNNSIGFLNQSGNWVLRVAGGDYTQADGSSMRAQMFYDSNDTSRYLDPNGTSVLQRIFMYKNNTAADTGNTCIYLDNAATTSGTTYNLMSDVSSYFGSRHLGFMYNGVIVGYIGAPGTTSVNYSTTSSDLRLKKNIEPWVENTLEKFEDIEPKLFNFNFQEEGEDKDRGFIAQEMVDKFPEAYPHDNSLEEGKSGYYSFNPSGMVVYLMKALKEQTEINKSLISRIEALENK